MALSNLPPGPGVVVLLAGAFALLPALAWFAREAARDHDGEEPP